jgi:hypothetical protein
VSGFGPVGLQEYTYLAPAQMVVHSRRVDYFDCSSATPQGGTAVELTGTLNEKRML